MRQRLNVKLYRIEDGRRRGPELVEGVAPKVTESYIHFAQRDVFSRFDLRTHGRNLGIEYFESPLAAWEKYIARQHERGIALRIEVEQNIGNRSVAQHAIDAIRDAQYDALRHPERDAQEAK